MQLNLQARSVSNGQLMKEVSEFIREIMSDDVWIITYQVGAATTVDVFIYFYFLLFIFFF